MAAVLTSIASTAMNLPIVRRQIAEKTVLRPIVLATAVQALVGVLALAGQLLLLRHLR